MFGIGSTELLVILVVALLVLGPKNLPKVAHTLGKAMGEFRRVSTEFQRTLNTEIALEEEKDKRDKVEKELAAKTSPSPQAGSLEIPNPPMQHPAVQTQTAENSASIPPAPGPGQDDALLTAEVQPVVFSDNNPDTIANPASNFGDKA